MKSYQDGGLCNDWCYAKINLEFLAYSSSNLDASNSDDNNSESIISEGALVCGKSVFTNYLVKKKSSSVLVTGNKFVCLFVCLCVCV